MKDDLVMLLVKAIPVGETKAFEWSGPRRAVTVILDVDYRIQYLGNIANRERKRGRRKNVEKYAS